MVINRLADNVTSTSAMTISYPIDWRTKLPVIILTSKQWFINTDRIKDAALDAVSWLMSCSQSESRVNDMQIFQISKVDIYPMLSATINRNNLTNQLKLRPYWCISRQRVWGTPIPVFYAKDSGKEIVNGDIIEHLCTLLETEGNMDFWWKCTVAELVPQSIWSKHNIDVNNVINGEVKDQFRTKVTFKTRNRRSFGRTF